MIELTTCLAAAALLLAGVGCALWMAYLSREPELHRQETAVKDLEQSAKRAARRLDLLESAAQRLDARTRCLEQQSACFREQMDQWEEARRAAPRAEGPDEALDSFQKQVEALMKYQSKAKKN